MGTVKDQVAQAGQANQTGAPVQPVVPAQQNAVAAAGQAAQGGYQAAVEVGQPVVSAGNQAEYQDAAQRQVQALLEQVAALS